MCLRAGRLRRHVAEPVSRDHVVNHLAMHIGQAEVAAGVTVSQSLVIDAKQMKHGGVEIMGVYGVLVGQDAVFV